MKLGYFDFNPDYSIRPDDLARACEERGYDSLWLGEHINIPVSRRTPYPLGGELPKYYSHMRDPFISLMAAGAVTKTLKLATGICLMIERDPITTAKEVATLDSLSNGRVIFGIGGGWNAEEMENHGTRFDRRWKVLRERVLCSGLSTTATAGARPIWRLRIFGALWLNSRNAAKGLDVIRARSRSPSLPRVIRRSQNCTGIEN
jgi:hypothetical protein